MTPVTRRMLPSAAAAVAAWTALVGLAVWWGQRSIVDQGLAINAAPFAGRWSWQPRFALIVPALLGAAVVAWGPRVAAAVPWRRLPLLAAITTVAWTVALAASDGWARVTAPLATRHEYEPFAAGIDDPGEFLRGFVEQLPGQPIHVQGHPPGAPLVPWLLDQIGLAGAGWFAALVIVAWGVAIAAALVAARALAGEEAARRAAPAMVVLPAAVWAGTSADALFAGVLAVGVALVVTGRRGGVIAGGVVLGVGLLLTYGGLAVALIAGVVALARRRVAAAATAAATTVAVLIGVRVLAGFSWLEGLEATRTAYEYGVASDRPDDYFALAGNPAALAVAIGPAGAVGLAAAMRRWRSAAALLPLVTLAVLVLVDASLLSKGEVERIWLPFVPWLALALPGHRRGWLAVQVGVALVVQAWLRSKW